QARSPFTIRAEMLDSAGRLMTGYSGPAKWKNVYGQISPSSPNDFVNGVSTTATTIASPSRDDQIRVTGGRASGQSAPFNVLGPLDHIAISVIPTTVTIGQGFTVQATARDALGDIISDYAAPASWIARSGALSPTAPNDFSSG